MKNIFRFLRLVILSLFVLSDVNLEAQSLDLGDEYKLTFNGTSRTRYDFEDWYGKQDQKTAYNFPSEKIRFGADLKKNNFKLLIGGQYYGIYNLEPGSTGPAGGFLSTNENHTWPASLSLRVASIEYSSSDFKISLGRQNYYNGQGGKIDPNNADLIFLSKWRIAQRVIGASEFTAGRSFDGFFSEVPVLDPSATFQAAYFKPTEGSGKVDPTRQMTDINLGVISFTKDVSDAGKQIGQAQVFYYYYDDNRNLVKVDNRDIAVRQNDFNAIRLHNFGGHWIGSIPVGADSIDTTLWGIAQVGDWGFQTQQAWAGVAELGYHFNDILWKPWFRGGINITSGDGSNSSKTHSTFSQLINTPRNFALTPFFNMQNMNDQFVQVLAHPTESITFRSDLHNLMLTNSNDLLYSGAGASRTDSFGYGGIASNGSSNVGTLWDIGANYKVNSHLSFDTYFGYVWGGSVIKSNYSSGRSDIAYGLIDLNLSF